MHDWYLPTYFVRAHAVFSSYAPVRMYEYHIGRSDEIRTLASNDGVIICENGHRAVLASEV